MAEMGLPGLTQLVELKRKWFLISVFFDRLLFMDFVLRQQSGFPSTAEGFVEVDEVFFMVRWLSTN